MPDNHLVFHYFVEGECEEKFINAFKCGKYAFLKPGKVEVLNPVNSYISPTKIRSLKQNTVVVLVYDIDKGNTDVLKENLKRFEHYSIIKIVHVQSIMNFEDEIVFSSNVKTINDVFGTKGIDNFKSEFLKHKDIVSKLNSISFNNTKIWSRTNTSSQFNEYSKQSYLATIKK